MTTKYWNAQDAGCGSLIVGLKREIGGIAAGELLQVTASNEGAPADIPSWCRVTGHTLVSAAHPNYVLQKKDN
jgi:tRNA 2-thiouridine synthesizing protein A